MFIEKPISNLDCLKQICDITSIPVFDMHTQPTLSCFQDLLLCVN